MLEELLKTHAYRTGEFTLTSGQKSNEYLDVKEAIHHPYAGPMIVRRVLKALDLDNGVTNSGDEERGCVAGIAGIESGSIALAAMATFLRNIYASRACVLLTVLKEQRVHGTQQRVIGVPALAKLAEKVREPLFVSVVEDVWTTGESTAKAIRALLSCGIRVARCVAVVDREQGAFERLLGEFSVVEFEALTTLSKVRAAKV